MQEEQHPELCQAIQQHVLRQAVQVSAQQRLEKLVADGILSDTIAKNLEEELESEEYS